VDIIISGWMLLKPEGNIDNAARKLVEEALKGCSYASGVQGNDMGRGVLQDLDAAKEQLEAGKTKNEKLTNIKKKKN
jgi:hypothetical protein